MLRAFLAAVTISGAALISFSASASSPTVTPNVTAHASFLAAVNSDGTIARHTPTSVTSSRLGTGIYEVDFPRDVSGCYYLVTSGTPTASSQLGVVTTVAARAGNVNGIFVANYNTAGTNVDSSSYVEVVCP